MKKVQFSGPSGRGKSFLVSDEDYAAVSSRKWYLTSTGYVFPAVHRFIMEPPPGMYVDHKNHDLLDNRRVNLRVCTPRQNTWNRVKLGRPTSSSHIGVRQLESGYWEARIFNGMYSESLGRFTVETDAALAYNEAAIRLHGEFAYLNEVA